jgi:hypothetical protein
MRYRWRLAPAAPVGGPGDCSGATPQYGVLLAQALGMPAPVLARARTVAEALEAERRARVAAVEGGGDGDGGGGGAGGGIGGGHALREVYHLVHRLGCVARKAGAGAAGGGGSGGGGGGGGGSGDAESGRAAVECATVQLDAAALAAALPLLRELKGEAERLCFRG